MWYTKGDGEKGFDSRLLKRMTPVTVQVWSSVLCATSSSCKVMPSGHEPRRTMRSDDAPYKTMFAVQNEAFWRCVVPFDDAMCKTRLLTMYCAKQGLFTMCRAKQGLLTTRRAKRGLLAMYCAFWRCTVQNKASDDALCKTRPSHDVPCKTRPSDDACTVQLPSDNALSLTIDASLVQSNGPRSCTAHTHTHKKNTSFTMHRAKQLKLPEKVKKDTCVRHN